LNQQDYLGTLYISLGSSDYTAVSRYRYLRFNGATRSHIVTVSIRDDMVVEDQFEQFFINLREYESAVILNGPKASITIEDNDSELFLNICISIRLSVYL